jgi:hypothetical protein
MNRVNDVRVELYRSFIDEQRAPEAGEKADRLRISLGDVRSSLRDLAKSDVIAFVPARRTCGWCIPSAPGRLRSRSQRTNASGMRSACGMPWGVLALFESDGTVSTSCPDCAEPIVLEIEEGEVAAPPRSLVHFDVPASRWYEDIGFT